MAYAPLPAYVNPGNAMINFQPLEQAIGDYSKGMTVAGESTAKINAANAMARGDYQAAQGELAKVDPRAAMEVGMYPGKKESQDNELRMQTAKMLGGHAQTILDIKDPDAQKQAASKWLGSDPKFSSGLGRMGMPDWTADPVGAVKLIHGEALGAQEPEKRALMQAEAAKASTMQLEPGNKAVNINANSPNAGAGQTIAGGELSMKTPGERAQVATNMGLKPGTVEYNAVVANGKLPDVVPDHKAIQAADEQVRAADSLVLNLKTALDYSKTASTGLGAQFAPLANTTFGGTAGTKAAAQFDNVVQSAVLPGLKALFGARVTNIDVQLSKDLAGASTQPPEVREAILKRAINRANELRAEKDQESKQLRTGTYYKPGGGATLPQTGETSSVREAREAIAKGANRDAVIKRLQENGIDPAGL